MKSDRLEILKSGYRVVEQVGFSGLTARSVAKEGGMSTQPIYLTFHNMAGLRNGVTEYIFTLIKTKYFKDNKTISSFLQNYTRFAQDYPKVLLALFLDKKDIRYKSNFFFHNLLKESIGREADKISDTNSYFLLARITGIILYIVETQEIEEKGSTIEKLLEELVLHDFQILRNCK